MGVLGSCGICWNVSRWGSGIVKILFCENHPAEKSGEYFGLYDICGKGASFLGTFLVGVFAQITGQANGGIFILTVMFIIGFSCLQRQTISIRKNKRRDFMPAIYAHDTFGKLVSKQLPKEIQDIIKTYPSAFRIGLQGPDPLFYHRPYASNDVKKEGSRMHRESCASFLQKTMHHVKKEGVNSKEFAYLLGFLCHFTLDSECHPYIDAYIEPRNLGHLFLES